MRRICKGRQRACIAAACAAFVQPLLAADGIWINSASDSDWSIPANWAGGTVADGVDAVANFATLDLAGPLVVNLDSPRTVGTLLFQEVGTGVWTLSGGGSLTLARIAGTPVIDVSNAGGTTT